MLEAAGFERAMMIGYRAAAVYVFPLQGASHRVISLTAYYSCNTRLIACLRIIFKMNFEFDSFINQLDWNLTCQFV